MTPSCVRNSRSLYAPVFSMLATVTVTVALLVAGTSTSFAQSNPPPGASCGPVWLLKSTMLYNVKPKGCLQSFHVIVWYCVPDSTTLVFPKEQIVIKAVTVVGGGPFPCPLSGKDMRNIGEFIMFEMNPEGWTPPTCSEWCNQHPECFCPVNYPQWVFGNGSCGRTVMVADTTSIVMCGETDDENGQNCYYLYHVCKIGIQLKRTLVGKITPDNCPAFGMPSECSIPMCDPTAVVTTPPPDTCGGPESTSPVGNPELSSVGSPVQKREIVTSSQHEPFSKAIRREE